MDISRKSYITIHGAPFIEFDTLEEAFEYYTNEGYSITDGYNCRSVRFHEYSHDDKLLYFQQLLEHQKAFNQRASGTGRSYKSMIDVTTEQLDWLLSQIKKED